MSAFNSSTAYGLVSVILHWGMALVIVGLFSVGLYMVELTYYDDLYKTLPFFHKSVGVTLAAFLIFRFIWNWFNIKPDPLANASSMETKIASLVHALFYLLIATIVFSGYLISTADGAPIDVFGLFSLPASITWIPHQEDIAGLIHLYLGYSLAALVLLHAGAALKHHFIDKDNILRRMLLLRLIQNPKN